MVEDNQRDDGTADDETTGTDDHGEEIPVRIADVSGDERGEHGSDRAIEQFDETIVDLLSWVLDTETRARIYVHLRKHPGSTSGEIAEGTGLYPSTVRESLAALNADGKVSRRKRQSEGAGNNPYEYTAIAPSELVGGVVGQIQDELNTVFNLDRHLGRETETIEPGPVTINVDEENEENEEVADDGGTGDERGGVDGRDAESEDGASGGERGSRGGAAEDGDGDGADRNDGDEGSADG